jgi:hypothetical protein
MTSSPDKAAVAAVRQPALYRFFIPYSKDWTYTSNAGDVEAINTSRAAQGAGPIKVDKYYLLSDDDLAALDPASLARIEALEEYYAAAEELRTVGLMFAGEDLFQRVHDSRAALTLGGPDAC